MVSIRNAALAWGRAKANEQMTETVTVGLEVKGSDPVTNRPFSSIPDPRYEDGPARIKYESLAVGEKNGPGQPLTTQNLVLSVPTGTTRLQEGDAVHVTASTVDDILIDRWYRISGSPASGATTSHRYPIVEL